MDAQTLLQTMSEISQIENAQTSTAFLLAGSVMGEKVENFTEVDELGVLENEKYTTETKQVMIELTPLINNRKGIINQEEFCELLLDETVDTMLKGTLINNLDFEGEQIAFLERLIDGDETELVIPAFRTLGHKNFDKALSRAEQVLENPDNYSITQIRGAVWIKSEYFQQVGNEKFPKKDVTTYLEDKAKFIQFCLDEYAKADNTVVKDTMIFALSGMRDWEALKAIVADETIDQVIRGYCVGQNYPTLLKLLEEDLSETDVDMLIETMRTRPIMELAPLIKENVTGKTEQQQERLDEIVAMIEASGNHGNPKWLEY